MGLLAIQTPEQVQQRLADDERRKFAVYQPDPVTDALAGHVKKCWAMAKTNRIPLTQRLLDCLRRKNGEYDAQKLAAIQATRGSAIYMMISTAKIRAAKAWLSDLFNPAGDKPWTLEATPVAELPNSLTQQLINIAMQKGIAMGVDPAIVQELLIQHRDRLLDEFQQAAEERAEQMAKQIEDMFVESGWRNEFDKFLDDLCTFPFAIMKGLEYKHAKQLTWVDMGTGKCVPMMQKTITPTFRRVSPFNFYPSPSIEDSFDGHWSIEHHRYTRSDLAGMRNAPGYDAEAIAMVLTQYGSSGLREWMFEDSERERIEGRRFSSFNTELIDAIEWSGSIQGQRLIEWGMNPQSVPDVLDEYQVSITVIGNYTVRALMNPDPAGKPQYFKSCWMNMAGQFAGKALPEMLEDCQDMCNAAARSLSNNMGISSGPQVWVEQDRLAIGTDASSVYPWKIWYTRTGPHSGPGVGFFQPTSNVNELLEVYERFSNYADEITGLPAYAYGSDAGAGAAKTMGGLSILMNAASKTVKDVVRGIDLHIIEPAVEKCFNHQMLHNPDESIKGDCKPKAQGSESLVHKEQAQLRQQELLGITNNPLDHQIIGFKGRAEMLRTVLKSGDIAVDRIVPSDEEIEANVAMQQQALAAQQSQPQQSNAGAQR